MGNVLRVKWVKAIQGYQHLYQRKGHIQDYSLDKVANWKPSRKEKAASSIHPVKASLKSGFPQHLKERDSPVLLLKEAVENQRGQEWKVDVVIMSYQQGSSLS